MFGIGESSRINSRDVQVPLFALAGLSLLVLLVAATNAAHLVLTRGRQRAAAFAVMDALGASRGELARVVLLETALLATFAVGLAFFLCWVVWKLSPDLSDSGLPIDPELGFGLILNPNLALAALLLSVVSIALAGAYPAWNIAKTGAGSALRAQRSGARAKYWLGIPGTALSLVALFCAGLFVSSSLALRDQRLGLNVDDVVNAQLFMRGEPGQDSGPKFAAQAQALLAGAQKIPGAQAVAVSNGVPFTPVFAPRYELSGSPALPGNAVLQTTVISVLGDSLKTLGYSLRAGRGLNAADSANAARVILVSEGFAKQYFGKADALGGTVTLPANYAAPGSAKPLQFSVVGVFTDARRVAPNIEPRPEVWVPFAQYPAHSLAVLVRGAPGGLKAVQEVVWQQDPTQAIFKAYAISDDLAALTAAPRFFCPFRRFIWLAGVDASGARQLRNTGFQRHRTRARICFAHRIGREAAEISHRTHVGKLNRVNPRGFAWAGLCASAGAMAASRNVWRAGFDAICGFGDLLGAHHQLGGQRACGSACDQGSFE